jgi:hypothetical protein
MPVALDEEETWAPPPTAWTWGQGFPLEPVRFAAANHLCIDLGYSGETHLIEPYSLRKTRSGKLVLHAVKVETREPRTYRVDRMESIRVTTQVFKPEYQIDFTTTGPIMAAPTPKIMAVPYGRTSPPPQHIYVVRWPVCGREFRHHSNDRTMHAHKNVLKQPCLGKGRQGSLVETKFE